MSLNVDALLRDLACEDRNVRLTAVFTLGEAFAQRGTEVGGDADALRVAAALDAIVDDRTAGTSWIRKRAKRALAKIRGRRADDEGGDLSAQADRSIGGGSA